MLINIILCWNHHYYILSKWIDAEYNTLFVYLNLNNHLLKTIRKQFSIIRRNRKWLFRITKKNNCIYALPDHRGTRIVYIQSNNKLDICFKI